MGQKEERGTLNSIQFCSLLRSPHPKSSTKTSVHRAKVRLGFELYGAMGYNLMFFFVTEFGPKLACSLCNSVQGFYSGHPFLLHAFTSKLKHLYSNGTSTNRCKIAYSGESCSIFLAIGKYNYLK